MKRQAKKVAPEVAQPADEKPQPNRRRLFALLLLLLISSFALYKAVTDWANAPVSGSVDVTSSGADVGRPAFQTVKTAYFSTHLPQNWYIRQDTSAVGRVQILAFASSGSDSSQVGIVSELLPTDGLQGVANYHLRASNPEDYALLDSSVLKLSQPATIFQKLSGPPQYSLFAAHGNRYVSVAITGANSAAESISLLKTIMSDWKWTN